MKTQKEQELEKEEKKKIEEEFRTAFEIVGEVLKENPQTRENDMILALEVWIRKQQIKCYVPYDKLWEMISYSTIHRVRQVWQNERGQYLPENPLVLVQRRIREKLIQDYFGKDKFNKQHQQILNEWQERKFGIKSPKRKWLKDDLQNKEMQGM